MITAPAAMTANATILTALDAAVDGQLDRMAALRLESAVMDALHSYEVTAECTPLHAAMRGHPGLIDAVVTELRLPWPDQLTSPR